MVVELLNFFNVQLQVGGEVADADTGGGSGRLWEVVVELLNVQARVRI